jgi:nucleoid DNA-binding protein
MTMPRLCRVPLTSGSNGDNFLLDSFGTFKVVERKGRNGVNPRTQEKLVIPAKKTVRFAVSPNFKKQLNEKD